MPRVDVPPFRRPRQGYEFAPVDVHELPWDMDTPLRATTRVTVEADAVRASAGLDETAQLAVALKCTCDHTYWSSADVRGVPQNGGQISEVALDIKIPARTVAHVIEFTTIILLAEDVKPGGPRSATRAGSVLATGGARRVDLEGGGGQFPVEAVPFRGHRVPGARWSLELDYDDPEEPFLGAARLYLNSDSDSVKLLRSDSSDPPSELVREVIGAELRRYVVATLVRSALDDDAVDDRNTWIEGSVGYVYRSMMDRYIDGMSPSELRSLRQLNSSRFEQLLEATVEDHIDG